MPEQVSKLIASGGMGGPLDPTSSAYSADGNASMWSAMSAWNAHDWETAVSRLKAHIQNFPADPWTGEATLHLAAHAFSNEDYEAAEGYLDDVISDWPGGAAASEAHLWLGLTYFRQGRLDDSTSVFRTVADESNSWANRTRAHNWLLRLSQEKSNALETGNYSECGRDSLKIAFKLFGDEENAAKIAAEPAPSFEGFTLAEVKAMSEKYGRPCWGVRVEPRQLASLSCPFIARYGSHHFVVVRRVADGGVDYTDPFSGEKSIAFDTFAASFKGEALVFTEVETARLTLLSADEMQSIRGGCCSVPLLASGPCPQPGESKCDCEETVPGGGQGGAGNGGGGFGSCPTCGSGGYGGSGGAAGGLAGAGGVDFQDSLLRPRRPIGGSRTGVLINTISPLPCKTCKIPPVKLNRRNGAVVLDIFPVYYEAGKGPDVEFLLRYDSKITDDAGFGNKWRFVYYSNYVVLPDDDVQIVTPDGRDLTFNEDSGSYDPPAGGYDTLVKNIDDSYTLTDYYTGYKYTYGATTQKIESIEDPRGNEVTVSWDASGYLTKVTDANSRETVFYPDASGRITKISDPFSNDATFEYDSGTGDLTRIVDAAGTAYTYEYDEDSYLTKRTHPNGSDTFEYLIPWSEEGVMEQYRIRYTGADNRRVEVEWDGISASSVMVVWAGHSDDASPTAKDGYKPHAQGVRYLTRAGAGSEANAYRLYEKTSDGYMTKARRRRVVSEGTFYDTTYDLDASNRRTKITYPDGREITFEYDGNGHVTKETLPGGAYVNYWYDSDYFLTRYRTPDGAYEEYYFDDDALLTRFVNKRGGSSTMQYDSYGYLTKFTAPDGGAHLYRRDLAGRTTRYTDPELNDYVYDYDGYNRVTKVTYPDASDAEYAYDCCRLTAYTDRGGRTTRYYRDGSGFATKVEDAEGRATIYAYQTDGFLTKVTDAISRDTLYHWDYSLGVVTKIDYPDNRSGLDHQGARRSRQRHDLRIHLRKPPHQDLGRPHRHALLL